MRQRTTFFHDGSADFDPKALQVTKKGVAIKHLKAAREDRLTLAVDELPYELRAVLSQTQDLYLRWVSPRSHKSSSPLHSRLSPGLHTFVTPRGRAPPTFLCFVFKKAFSPDLKCASVLDTFVYMPPPDDKSSTQTAFQYYHALPSLDTLITYMKESLCSEDDTPCRARVQALSSASYFDLNYAGSPDDLTVTAFWDKSPKSAAWNEDVQKRSQSDKVEIGLLANEKANEEGEISLGGWLTVLGDDKKPKPTLFSFPSRHHTLSTAPSTFTAHFPPPTGLHPTFRITLPSPPSPPPSISSPDTCTLHTYLTLPSYLFVDQYQLSDPLFLASLNLAGIRALHGATDLEAPDWVIPVWGSTLLLDVAHSTSPSQAQSTNTPFEISIPLHLRYLPPTNHTQGITPVLFPAPVVFWACSPTSADTNAQEDLNINPFDRQHLGYDTLFPSNTTFYHFEPRENSGGSQSLVETLNVPVLDLDKAQWVEGGTAVAVLLGFAWVVWKSFSGVLKPRTAAQGTDDAKRKKRN